MSITLSIPPAIVQEIREWAEENGTSLNQYVRDCLEAKCAELANARKARAKPKLRQNLEVNIAILIFLKIGRVTFNLS